MKTETFTSFQFQGKEWRIVPFHRIKLGTSFRHGEKWCVRTGPLSYAECPTAMMNPAKRLPYDLHTLVAAEEKDCDLD